jgi:EPS-associated MarR family transcriptional regulator
LLNALQHGGSVPELSEPLHEESHLKVLRLLESDPSLSQRELSQALGVSLGKTNYCVRALLDKGLIKMQNFRNSDNKLAYAYLLTPAGIAAKADLTRRFLALKQREYETLRQEIERLQKEVQDS